MPDRDDVEKDDKETGIGDVTAPPGPLDPTHEEEKERYPAAQVCIHTVFIP